MTFLELTKLEFLPMDKSDLECFAGVQNPETAIIAYDDNFSYIIDGDCLFLIDENGEQTEFALTQTHIFH